MKKVMLIFVILSVFVVQTTVLALQNSEETYTETCTWEEPADPNKPHIQTCIIKNSKGVEAVDPKYGYSRYVEELAPSGPNTWTTSKGTFYNPDGTLAVLEKGYSSFTMEHSEDDTWKTTITCFFDADDNLVMRTDGYACDVWSKAKDGSVSITRYLGLDGQPVYPFGNQGYVTVRYYFDANGNRTRKDFLGLNDELVPLAGQDYCTILFEKGSDGKYIEIDHLDAEGNHVEVKGSDEDTSETYDTPVVSGDPTQVGDCKYGTYLTAGDKAEIINVQAVRMFEKPGDSPIQGLNAFPGKEFTIIDGPMCMNGLVWWKINFLGYIGWASETDTDGLYYMEKR